MFFFIKDEKADLKSCRLKNVNTGMHEMHYLRPLIVRLVDGFFLYPMLQLTLSSCWREFSVIHAWAIYIQYSRMRYLSTIPFHAPRSVSSHEQRLSAERKKSGSYAQHAQTHALLHTYYRILSAVTQINLENFFTECLFSCGDKYSYACLQKEWIDS